MRLTLFAVAALLFSATPTQAQVSTAEIQEAIQAAELDPSVGNLLGATNASRFLGDHEAARSHYEGALDQLGGLFNAIISTGINLELASGGGVVGAQRAFREMRSWLYMPPVVIANVANNFPELLATGEFDELVLKLSLDATDPDYRCACLGAVAWVHELAGREDEAKAVWSSLADAQLDGMDDIADPDVAANTRGQVARNLARAGRIAEARTQLERALAMEVSTAAMPTVRRRWAQAYAELGDAEGAVEHLEPLLETRNDINVHTLEARVSWRRIRNAPAFQAMLERHR